MHISDHEIIKQLWCAALQTVLIKHVRPRLLLSHNEGLCVHQPVQMMNATLFSALAFWRRNKVSLCASSARQHQQTDTGERPSLLTQSSHYTPIPADTPPPPLALYMCSALTCICTREPHAAISSYSPVRDCALEQQSNFNLYGNIKGCCSFTPAHTHTRTSPHTSKASLHV